MSDDRQRSALYQDLHEFIWGTLRPDEKGRIPEIERALSAIRGFSMLGIFGIALYGATATGTFSTHGACIALLGAAGAFAIGGILGFLFGMPRWGDGTQQQPAPPPGNAKDESRAAMLQRIRPNTGLERIMDWLTTLIVGLGLVHLKEGFELGTEMSLWLTRAIVGDATARLPMNGSPGAAILVAYVIAGFFLVYLWAQRYMPREMVNAARESQIEEIMERINESDHATKQLMSGLAEQVLNIVPEADEQRFGPDVLDDPANPLGLPQDMIESLRNRYAKATGYNDEPLAEFGPAADRDRALEGSVTEASRGLGLYTIGLAVKSTLASKPLGQRVVFFLHHTLPDPIRVSRVKDGVAAISLPAGGSFVAGAAIPGEDTRLSIDLARLPGVSRHFIEN